MRLAALCLLTRFGSVTVWVMLIVVMVFQVIRVKTKLVFTGSWLNKARVSLIVSIVH